MEKIKVVIVPVDKEGYITEIKNDLGEMQKIVGGYLETVPTMTDDVLVVCNEEGMIHDLPKNVLGLYGQFFISGVKGTEFVSLTEEQANTVKKYINSQKGVNEVTKEKISLHELERNSNWEEAIIVFTKDSFDKDFSELERSYRISSDNKYFDSNMIGNSLFGDCLDGKDDGVRLDVYMNLDKNKSKRWEVDYCYIIK